MKWAMQGTQSPAPGCSEAGAGDGQTDRPTDHFAGLSGSGPLLLVLVAEY